MQATETPIQTSQVLIEGVSFMESAVEFLTDNGEVYNVSEAIVSAALPLETNIEECLLQKLPFSIQISTKGSEVVNVILR